MEDDFNDRFENIYGGLCFSLDFYATIWYNTHIYQEKGNR